MSSQSSRATTSVGLGTPLGRNVPRRSSGVTDDVRDEVVLSDSDQGDEGDEGHQSDRSSSNPFDDNLLPPTQLPSSQQPPSQASNQSKRKRKDDTVSRVRWVDEQVIYMLELVRDFQLEGDIYIEKPSACKAAFNSICSSLRKRFPQATFDNKKLARKLKDLRLIWKAYLAMQVSGVEIDSRSGRLKASKDNWAYFDGKFGKQSRYLRRYGLQRIELYEDVFSGEHPVGMTAVEAGDQEGIHNLLDPPIPISSDEEGDGEGDGEGEAGDNVNRDIPLATAEAEALPSSSNSTLPRPSARPPSRQSSSSARKDSSSTRSPVAKRPKLQSVSRSDIIEKFITTIAKTHSMPKAVRQTGASDFELAVQDVQERFEGKATEDEIDDFCDWLQQDMMRVVRYNSSNDTFKRRMLAKVTRVCTPIREEDSGNDGSETRPPTPVYVDCT